MPVVEDGRLVGVLSRAVVQRRLAEDETLDGLAAIADAERRRRDLALVTVVGAAPLVSIPNPHPPTGNEGCVANCAVKRATLCQ